MSKSVLAHQLMARALLEDTEFATVAPNGRYLVRELRAICYSIRRHARLIGDTRFDKLSFRADAHKVNEGTVIHKLTIRNSP